MNSREMLLLLISILIAFAGSSSVASLNDYFFISCGIAKSTTVTSLDNRVWKSDDDPSFSPVDINAVSSPATATDYGVQVPYTTARIFRLPLTYSFPVSPGPKFLRLYFSTSTAYNNIPPSQFYLSLQANGGLTLFQNFSPFLNSNSQNKAPPIYEFHLMVDENQTRLDLTFSPGTCSKSCYGFINAIEIVSVPNGLYINQTKTYRYLYSGTDYPIQNTTAFQTAYRLNVGGSAVVPANDAGGLGRAWYNDVVYVSAGGFLGTTVYPESSDEANWGINYTKVPPYSAPESVYGTMRIIGIHDVKARAKRNLTWVFEVDAGFDYLMRLHFCEMQEQVTGPGQRVFDVHINDIMRVTGVDVWDLSGGKASPIYTDYIASVFGNASNGTKVPLVLVLLPGTNTKVLDVLLNGLEILKLNQPNNSLAAPNPPLAAMGPTASPVQNLTSSGKGHSLTVIVVSVISSVILFSVTTFACLLLLHKRRVKKKATILSRASTDKSKGNNWVLPPSIGSGSSTSAIGSSLPSDLCRRFSLAQIRVATSDFDENLVVGTGGFGKVYKGPIDGGATTVAIKRLNPTSKQGAHEFLTEIEMLSRLRHLHLVSLIGYCDDHAEMILVYEYMPRGTLRDHLMYKDSNNSTNTPLSWKQRLMICVGSARGLHYLHAGAKELIIHRDVKSTNILLDDKWTAKVSDFGLSKVGPASETGVGHVSTAVKGSIGYLDPEYYKRQQLTEKSDVYSFGVVLFEVLCGRAAVNPTLTKQEVNLALWARRHYLSGTLHTIVDPNLTCQIAPECLNKFGEIAEMCVRDHGSLRPSMGDVVWGLEFALQLQETAEKNNINGGPLEGLLGPTGVIKGGDGGTTDDDVFTTSGENWSHSSDTGAMRLLKSDNTSESHDHVDMKSGSVFSEIMDPKAR